jgi:hypothetical protein
VLESRTQMQVDFLYGWFVRALICDSESTQYDYRETLIGKRPIRVSRLRRAAPCHKKIRVLKTAATVVTRTQDRTLLRVLRTVAAVAARTQDRTLLCVLKTVATATTQATVTELF